MADRALIKLLDGLIDEHAAQSDVQLREALGELGGSLVGSFHLLLEAGRTRRDPKVLLLRAGVDLNTTPADKEIVAFAHALNAAGDADNSLHTALGPLRAMLGRAAAMQLTEPDLLLVCEALHRRNERDLVRRYADRALQRWPGRPVFVYLKAAAAYGANPWQIPQRELSALEKALDEARSQGDQRTALRLRELLSAEEGEFGPPVGFEGDDVDELAGADPRAVLEMMLAFGGEDRFLDLTRQQLGKDAFEALRREIGGNKKRFVRALVDLLASAPLLPGLGANPAPPPRRGRRRPPPEQQKDLFGD